MKKIISYIGLATIGGLISIGAYKMTENPNTEATTRIVERTPVRYASMPVGSGPVADFTFAAEQTVNAVVHIETETMVRSSGNPWLDMLGQSGPQSFGGSGSGVIISADGYIVTNNHVIDEADRIQVTLNDNRTISAEVIGADPAYDLALIKVDEIDLPHAIFGNSDQVKIGEWVLAVGNPFNLTSTVTAGIVSAKARNINILEADPNRQIFPVESFIQTDAAVNPGNSGGALVNIRGELIGINTAIASRTGSYSGYSFAVPSSIVQKVTSDLLEYGNVQRAYIGVSISDLNQAMADELGVDDVSGVFINGLTPGGAASDVGMRIGDIIKAVNGENVDNVAELQGQVSKYRPGDEIRVSVARDNKILDYNVIVRDRQGNAKVNAMPAKLENSKALGAVFEEVSRNELDRLDIRSGVKLSKDLEGRFRRAGIKEGFIITEIDKRNISRPADVGPLLSSMEGGVLIGGIYPNGTVAYYGFGM